MKFWYLFSPLLAALNWILEKLKLEVVSLIAQLLSIYLILLGISEMRARRRKRKKIQKHLLKSKTMKTTELSLDPEGQAELLLEQLTTYYTFGGKIMKKLKKIIRWIAGNKFSIITVAGDIFTWITASMAVFADELYLAFTFLTPYKAALQVITPLLGALITAVLIFVLVKRCFDSNLTLEEYINKRKRKKELQQAIKEYEDKLIVQKEAYEAANSIIEKLEVKVNLMPNTLTQKQKDSYDEAYVTAPKLQAEVEGTEAQLQAFKDELASIKI